MSATLSSLVKSIFDRTLATKRVAALTGGTRNVDSVIVTNAGSGYTSAPAVGFSGGGGVGAAATATVANGVVVAITVTNPGTGYTSTPTVTFTGGGGSGAAASAITAATALDAIATTAINAGEMLALVSVAQTDYVYQLVSGTDAEAAPALIRPDDFDAGTNGKVWKLQGLYVNALTLLDGSNVVLGSGTGSQIGTASTQKLSLFGVAPTAQPVGAEQAAVTLGNTDGAISGLTFSDPPTQAEAQALRDACETLADDLRNLSTLIHALRSAGVALGIWKGAA